MHFIIFIIYILGIDGHIMIINTSTLKDTQTLKIVINTI